MVKPILFDTRTRDQNTDIAYARAIASVRPIHTRVPGRARFKVSSLYRSRPVKRRLESELHGAGGISIAYGNELTGNLLVVFDRRRTVQDIVRLIADTLARWAPPAEVHGQSAVPQYRPVSLPNTTEPVLLSSQALHFNALPAVLITSSPLVQLPIAFLRTFLVGLFQASPIFLLFTTSIAILGLVVGKKEDWSRSDALYFAFATASTVGFNDLRPTKTSTKILSIAIGILGLLLTGMVTALGFLSAQRAFQQLP